jgi:hypothetical protein
MAYGFGGRESNPMPALKWHPDALGDIERLYDFLAPVDCTHLPALLLRAGRLW